MKKVLILLSLVSVVASGQNIKVASTRQVKGIEPGKYSITGVSPDGKSLLLTGENFRGLYIKDVRGTGIKKISEEQGAGFEPGYSGDGRYIYFRSDDFTGLKKRSSLFQYEIPSGKTTLLAPAMRNMTPPAVTRNRIMYSADGKTEARAHGGAALKSLVKDTCVILEDLTPVLYIGDERIPLKPNGDGSYIWVSLSPDKKMLLYCVAGKGTFISDLNGKILYTPGRVNAPKWLTDKLIVGMDDRDDGYRTTSSEVVIYSLTSRERKYITRSDKRIEIYPYPFPDGRRVAFQTPEGELFIISLTVK